MIPLKLKTKMTSKLVEIAKVKKKKTSINNIRDRYLEKNGKKTCHFQKQTLNSLFGNFFLRPSSHN